MLLSGDTFKELPKSIAELFRDPSFEVQDENGKLVEYREPFKMRAGVRLEWFPDEG